MTHFRNPNKPSSGDHEWPQYDLESQSCFKFKRDITDIQSVTIPYCNARQANFLLDIIPEVMSSISNSNNVALPYGQEYTGMCAVDGNCE